jgi:2-C-methyl-D-erythritol 4-phosphate cytidylyltransferase
MAQVWAIVVAAGEGQRFGQLKQFALLGGRPVADWAVDACRRCASGVVLVVPPGWDTAATHGADIAVEGGSTRSDSVRRGLAKVPVEAEVIVVHDAVRPLASDELFDAVIAAVGEERVAGAVPGVAVSDTIKQVDGAMQVIATLDRGSLVAVQTPQAFRAQELRRAHTAAGEATDDAALVEAVGAAVRIVPGDPRNLKITTPADLRAAEQLLGG